MGEPAHTLHTHDETDTSGHVAGCVDTSNRWMTRQQAVAVAKAPGGGPKTIEPHRGCGRTISLAMASPLAPKAPTTPTPLRSCTGGLSVNRWTAQAEQEQPFILGIPGERRLSSRNSLSSWRSQGREGCLAADVRKRESYRIQSAAGYTSAKLKIIA